MCSSAGRCDSRSAQVRIVASGIVQLVRDAGDRLAERRELLRLQQLMIEIARLILEALALADVAHERFDAQAVAAALGVRRHLDPHRRLVGAAQAEQVVADGAVTLEPAEEPVARLRIDEALELEGAHVLLSAVSTPKPNINFR